MAFKKLHLFPAHDQRISAYARALGHPARIEILRLLSTMQECQAEYIFKTLPLSKATVSGHLGLLRKTGLLKYREERLFIFYSLDEKEMLKLRQFLHSYCSSVAPVLTHS